MNSNRERGLSKKPPATASWRVYLRPICLCKAKPIVTTSRLLPLFSINLIIRLRQKRFQEIFLKLTAIITGCAKATNDSNESNQQRWKAYFDFNRYCPFDIKQNSSHNLCFELSEVTFDQLNLILSSNCFNFTFTYRELSLTRVVRFLNAVTLGFFFFNSIFKLMWTFSCNLLVSIGSERSSVLDRYQDGIWQFQHHFSNSIIMRVGQSIDATCKVLHLSFSFCRTSKERSMSQLLIRLEELNNFEAIPMIFSHFLKPFPLSCNV